LSFSPTLLVVCVIFVSADLLGSSRASHFAGRKISKVLARGQVEGYNIEMADKIMRSLIYDDHPIPKRSRALKERLKVPVAIALVLIFVSGMAYKFANYREERRVRQFMEEVEKGQFDTAYKDWDADAKYPLKEFLQDWGKEGYYTKGMHEARVIDSNGQGGAVVVYVDIDTLKSPVALRVDKETLKISFSPNSKYPSP